MRDVASGIAANKVVMDTEFHNTISIAVENDIVNNKVVDEVNCTVNTANDQTANETIFQHVTLLSLTQEEFYIQYLNVIMKLLKSNQSKKEFILQTAVKHYLMTSSK